MSDHLDLSTLDLHCTTLAEFFEATRAHDDRAAPAPTELLAKLNHARRVRTLAELTDYIERDRDMVDLDTLDIDRLSPAEADAAMHALCREDLDGFTPLIEKLQLLMTGELAPDFCKPLAFSRELFPLVRKLTGSERVPFHPTLSRLEALEFVSAYIRRMLPVCKHSVQTKCPAVLDIKAVFDDIRAATARGDFTGAAEYRRRLARE